MHHRNAKPGSYNNRTLQHTPQIHSQPLDQELTTMFRKDRAACLNINLFEPQKEPFQGFVFFCRFSSSCDASFNMSVASLCIFSFESATACM